MISQQTYLIVSDNTGARSLMCIRVVGRSFSTLGGTVIAVVKESLPGINVRRSEVVRAVLVRIVQSYSRVDGSRIRFDQNAAVIINKEGNPRGSRIFGPIARELRRQKYTKILSLAPEIILHFL